MYRREIVRTLLLVARRPHLHSPIIFILAIVTLYSLSLRCLSFKRHSVPVSFRLIAACWNASKAISGLSSPPERGYVKWHRLFLLVRYANCLRVCLSLSRAPFTSPCARPTSLRASLALCLFPRGPFSLFCAHPRLTLSYKLERLSRDLRLEKIRDSTLSCGQGEGWGLGKGKAGDPLRSRRRRRLS